MAFVSRNGSACAPARPADRAGGAAAGCVVASWLMRFSLLGLRYAWALPATLVGLALALAAWVTGARLRAIDGAIEAAGGRVAFLVGLLPRRLQFDAITLGHVIIGRDDHALRRVREHEHVHVRQYEHWGVLFFPAYLGSSLLQWLRGRDPYRDNRFEREAFAASASERWRGRRWGERRYRRGHRACHDDDERPAQRVARVHADARACRGCCSCAGAHYPGDRGPRYRAARYLASQALAFDLRPKGSSETALIPDHEPASAAPGRWTASATLRDRRLATRCRACRRGAPAPDPRACRADAKCQQRARSNPSACGTLRLA